MFLSRCSGGKFGDTIARWGTDPVSPVSQRRDLWQRAAWMPSSIGSAAKGKLTAPMYFLVSLSRKGFSVADVRNAPVQLSATTFDE